MKIRFFDESRLPFRSFYFNGLHDITFKDYDPGSLPDQFSLEFFDYPDQDPYVDLPI